MSRFSLVGFAFLLPLGGGCSSGEVDLGGGPEPDSRLTADIVTWECQDNEGGFSEGTYGFTLALEYAPDRLEDRALPDLGDCEANLSMFAVDAGNAGADIPGLDSKMPSWVTSTRSGTFEEEGPGFYYDDVLGNSHLCDSPADVVTSGVMLQTAADLSGVTTPPAGELDAVIVEEESPAFGDTIHLRWVAEDWDETWIQIRMEREGQAWGTATCNASGTNEFVVDDEGWDTLSDVPNVEYIKLYVGFQNTENKETEAGLKVETITRVVHVEVLQEL